MFRLCWTMRSLDVIAHRFGPSFSEINRLWWSKVMSLDPQEAAKNIRANISAMSQNAK
jgi:hypothetical protein